MMDTVGKGVDGTGDHVGYVVIDDGAMCTIFLIGDVHCGLGCCVKSGQRCSVRDNVVCMVIECDVTDIEPLHVALVIASVACVFADS